MAFTFYTPPPSLPRTPPTYLCQWPQQQPLTPPMSPKPVLPPISNLDFELDSPQPALFADANKPVDWLDFARERSPRFIAEKTCEMICYLWFSSSLSPQKNSAANQLQLAVTPTFITFLQKLLETTQVSQSVIVLSLHYIYRLKERNQWTPAQEGSEFRIAVAALMMANKFLDDNTYTNKTWSEVSGISLTEINRMEREFLIGVDSNLYVSQPTYESWLNLLKGLVYAKERDSRRLTRKRRTHPQPTPTKRKLHLPRARSTSPAHHLPLPVPSYTFFPLQDSPTKSGNKRSADTAFSPPSAEHTSVPSKRPVSMILTIPETRYQPPSYSPLEAELKNMSIDSPIDVVPPSPPPAPVSRSEPEKLGDMVLPSERMRMMETARAPPGRLYFWTAASRTPPSSRDNDEVSSDSSYPISPDGEKPCPLRPKARLRYQPSTNMAARAPQVPAYVFSSQALFVPQSYHHYPVAQSARTSPSHAFSSAQLEHHLPSSQDSVWRKERRNNSGDDPMDGRRLPPLQRLDFNNPHQRSAQYYAPAPQVQVPVLHAQQQVNVHPPYTTTIVYPAAVPPTSCSHLPRPQLSSSRTPSQQVQVLEQMARHYPLVAARGW